MRNSYHTQQRCALLAFLSAHADEQFTVEQLLAAMGDAAPGRSTVYRALDRLVEEGTVRRFAPESGGSAAYQAMDPGHCDAHLHLKCVGCEPTYVPAYDASSNATATDTPPYTPATLNPR